MERAKTIDPEKIIALWEGDTYRGHNRKFLRMRACDHKAIQDLTIEEYVAPDQQKNSMTVEPYYWFKNSSCTGFSYKLPAGKVLPWMDPRLDRYKGKSGWGN